MIAKCGFDYLDHNFLLRGAGMDFQTDNDGEVAVIFLELERLPDGLLSSPGDECIVFDSHANVSERYFFRKRKSM